MSSSVSESSDDSLDHNDDDGNRRKRKRKETSRKKDRKKEKKRKKRRKRSYESSSEEDDSSRDERRKKKKDRKKKRKRRDDDESANQQADDRNHVLMVALVDLLTACPAMSDDLSTILIRLAGGTSFDLSQMTDQAAAFGLKRVFEALQPFGVQLDDNGAWQWQAPGGGKQANPLVLVRVVRAMMDQAGMTMEAIQEYESPPRTSSPVASAAPPIAAATTRASFADDLRKSSPSATSLVQSPASQHGTQQAAARDLLSAFGAKNEKLPDELAGLVKLILDDGETVSLEGLPDADLRKALEALFASCGLEHVEMEVSDDDESDNEDEKQEAPTMGFALPDESSESQSYEIAKARLASVLTVCRRAAAGESLEDVPSSSAASTVTAPRVVFKGPTLPTSATRSTAQPVDSDDDDEEPAGPLPFAKQRGPQLPPQFLKERAARRALELANAKKGIATAPEDASGREEWMLVPGKYDFMNSKAANPLKSRQFNNPKNRGGGTAAAASADEVDDSIKHEIDSIRQSYETARGPSLLEQHQTQKREAAAAAQQSGKKESWKWNRDKDLDDGRRVDKNALNMVLGNAGKELKSKFQGGY